MSPLEPPRWLRNEDTRKILSKTRGVLEPIGDDDAARVLAELLPAADGAEGAAFGGVRVSPSLVADMDILDWARGLARTRGGALAAERCLRAPISDVGELAARGRRALRTSLDRKARRAREILRDAEADALWWFARDVRATLPLFPILFPQWFALRWMNRAPPLITGYHAYRGYLTPLMVALAPLSTILGPYWYIRRTLKWQLSLASYLGFLKNGLLAYLRPAPGALPEHTAFKYAALGIYVAVTVYGILQALDIAKIFREVREALLAKTESVRRVLAEFGGRDGRRNGAAVLPSGIAGAYALATNPRVRARVAEALRLGYSQDLAILGGDLLSCGGRRDPRARKSAAWCLPIYGVRAPSAKSAEAPGATKIWAMRHPTLADGGRPNPAALARSILVTGPNAAGKTTYMKALAANLLLAQTFGIVCAARAEVVPVDMFGSFVRVGDSVGVASLFQAEVARCRELCADAAAVSAAGGRAVLFLDEPMHSTPPTEGAATAVAVAKYLIALPGVRVVVTSHFAVMADIASELPALMANVCVRAELRADGGPPYSFTYRVQPGASFQSIALEMLEAEALPAEVVAGAVQMVNKICGKGVSN